MGFKILKDNNSLSKEVIKKRLNMFYNGICEGMTMVEIAKSIGISKQALSKFLNKYWDGKMK